MPTDSRRTQGTHEERPTTPHQHHDPTHEAPNTEQHAPGRTSNSSSEHHDVHHVASTLGPHDNSQDPRQTDQSPHRVPQHPPGHSRIGPAADTHDPTLSGAYPHHTIHHVSNRPSTDRTPSHTSSSLYDGRRISLDHYSFETQQEKTHPRAVNEDSQIPSTGPFEFDPGAISKGSEAGPVAPDGLAPPTLDDNLPVVDGVEVWNSKSPAMIPVPVDPRQGRHPRRNLSPASASNTNRHVSGSRSTRLGRGGRDHSGSAADSHRGSGAIPPDYVQHPTPPPDYSSSARVSSAAENPAENHAENPAGNTDNSPSLDRQHGLPLHSRPHTSDTREARHQGPRGRRAEMRSLLRRATGALINPFLASDRSHHADSDGGRPRNRLRRRRR